MNSLTGQRFIQKVKHMINDILILTEVIINGKKRQTHCGGELPSAN